MSIIITKNGKNAIRLEKTVIKDEDYLQKYISDNPESIPLNEIKEGIEILVLAREFETSSGPIDILITDREGEIYIIETKLYKNPDKRRVLAQVMDYGAALWKGYINSENFIDDINIKISRTYGISLNDKLQQVFNITRETTPEIIENLKNNLSEGSIRFLILMDRLDDRLKDLILFMNQNSKFDILAVELEMYKYENYEIVTPRIFGVDVKKDLYTGIDQGRYWDEENFFDILKEKIIDAEVLDIIRKIYDVVSKESMGDPFYTKTKTGTFNFIVKTDSKSNSLFHVRTDGIIRFFYLNDFKKWREALNSIGIATPGNKNEFEFSVDKFKKDLDLNKFVELIKKVKTLILGDK